MNEKTITLELTGRELTDLVYVTRTEAIKNEMPETRERMLVLQKKLIKTLNPYSGGVTW